MHRWNAGWKTEFVTETAMDMNLKHANICLEPRHQMSLSDAAGVEVTGLTGRVWLTMEGDLRDVILSPGNAHMIERDGLTLISASDPSLVHVRLRRAQPAAWKQRLERVWEWLASAGEARARAHLKRGTYY